jgi:anti-sigma B factor antagonist
MKVTKEERGDVSIFKIEGEIVRGNSSELSGIFADLIKQNPKKVMVDLSQVSFIDSAGVGALMDLHLKLKAKEGGVSLCAPAGTVEDLFRTTKLNQILPTYETLQDALADL